MENDIDPKVWIIVELSIYAHEYAKYPPHMSGNFNDFSIYFCLIQQFQTCNGRDILDML